MPELTDIDSVIAAWTARLDEQAEAARQEIEIAEHFRPDDCEDEYQWHRIWRKKGNGVRMGSSFEPGAPTPTEVLADIEAKRAVIAQYRQAEAEWRVQHETNRDSLDVLFVESPLRALESAIRILAGAGEQQ